MARGLGVVWRDVTLLMLAGFMVIVLLVLPFINDPPTSEEEVPPGNITVEMRWPDDLDIDIDLWVKAPGDRPVGYSRRTGKIFNLLRDDLGHMNDFLELNYEHAFSRGIPPGEYVVNVHYFSSRRHNEPVPVQIHVRYRTPQFVTRQIGATTVVLDEAGQEVTALRFTMDEDGRLVKDSIHSDYFPLRSYVEAK